VVALAGLVYLHQRDLHRQRRYRDRLVREKMPQRLAAVRELYPLRQVDEAYADVRSGVPADAPYDWEADALAAALERLP
jgi:hypothetical protein